MKSDRSVLVYNLLNYLSQAFILVPLSRFQFAVKKSTQSEKSIRMRMQEVVEIHSDIQNETFPEQVLEVRIVQYIKSQVCVKYNFYCSW